MKIETLPSNDKTNGWDVILQDRTPHAALDRDTNADWLVVGAGYAGLPLPQATVMPRVGPAPIERRPGIAPVFPWNGRATWGPAAFVRGTSTAHILLNAAPFVRPAGLCLQFLRHLEAHT